MNLSLSTGHMVELAAAVLLLAAAIFYYRRRDASDRQGGQGAVILGVIGLIMAIHALGLLNYHPTQAEADSFNSRPR